MSKLIQANGTEGSNLKINLPEQPGTGATRTCSPVHGTEVKVTRLLISTLFDTINGSSHPLMQKVITRSKSQISKTLNVEW